MNILNYIVIIFFVIGLVLIFISEFITLMNKNKPTKKGPKDPSFCVLIPARDESKVITGLLDSIKSQTVSVDMKDIYIIVEDSKDKTIGIADNYGCSVVIRKDLDGKRRKGYALDECVKKILKKERHYELYFIFDADNILDKNYFKEMIKTSRDGYDIGIGYRNCKNGNSSVVAAASILVFSLVNTFSNTRKQKHDKSLTISGTGFYIRGKYIEEWGEYPFHTLTEDYELTLYATLNDLTSYYNNKAIYYDEQPIRYVDTINQRTRWIKGYFEARKKYIKRLFKSLTKKDPNYGSKLSECIGVIPYLFIIISFVFYFILQIFVIYTSITTNNENLLILSLKSLLIIFVFIYVSILLLVIFLLHRERKMLNIKTSMKIKVCLYFPIFLVSYIQCGIRALFHKNIDWKRVEHDDTKIK